MSALTRQAMADPRRPILATVLAVIGLSLLAGGGYLLSLGGSAYYLLAGLAVGASALLVARGDRRGVWIYLALLAATAVSRAADDPVFHRGQWQFDRTVQNPGGAPQKLANSKCVDPAAEWIAQREKMAKLGCQITPVAHSGQTWHFTASCRIGSVTATSDNVLKVESPDAYTVTVDGVTAGMKTHELLVARRVGECAQQP